MSSDEEPAGGEPVTEQAREAAAPAKKKAREVAGEAKAHAQAAAGQAKQTAAAQVDEKSTQLGQQIGSQGEALEGVAGELRRQGKDGQARVAEQAAEKVGNVGDYLEQADAGRSSRRRRRSRTTTRPQPQPSVLSQGSPPGA